MVLTWKEKLYFLLWGSGSMESMGQGEESRPFVKEHIVPSKKRLQREFLKSLGRMFLYGAVFGIAAGLFLIMTKNFFEKGKESKEKQSSLSTIVKDKESITDKIDSIKTDLENEEEKSLSNQKKKETADQRKKSSIQEAYDKKIKEINQSIISVLSKTQWTEGTKTTGMICFGAAIARDQEHFYFLAPYYLLPTEKEELQAEFFDGCVCKAEFTGKDEDANIAIISVKIEEIPENFQKKIEVIKLGESSQMQTGSTIMLLGCPNGSIYSADIGIVSGSPEKKYIMDYCLDLYPTNIVKNESGSGIVVSTDGKLFGMMTNTNGTIFGKNMVAFSGISSLNRIISKIISGKPMLYCGIRAEDIPQKKRVDMGITNGIYVVETKPDSPADRAGIRTGDIIKKVGEEEITSVMDFYTEISGYKKDDVINVHAVRISSKKKKENKFIVRLREKE